MNEGSLDNETALVTGGTDGIGKAIARGLATMGAEVFIVGSDPDKGRRAERELRAAAGHHRVYFLQADLSLMRETDRLADEVVERVPRLNRLVLCAGVVRGQRMETKEGVESNFAVNYLSRFVLTGRVLKLLEAGGTRGRAARIVVIGGTAMNGKIHYDDINLARSFGVFTLVRQFCQANDLFVIEQARRLAGAGDPRVTITTLKVGVVRTNIRRGFPVWMKVLVPLVLDSLLGQRPEQVADSALRLLVDPAFEGRSGLLFTHIKRFKAIEPGRRTRDPHEGMRLWDFSARSRGQGEMPSAAEKAPGDKMRFAPWLARFFLLLVAVIFGFVSWIFVSDPVGSAAMFQIAESSGAGATNLRVGFGAFPFAFTLIVLFCLFMYDRLMTGMTFATAMVAAVVGVRAVGVLIDGDTARNAVALAAGTVLLVLLLVSR